MAPKKTALKSPKPKNGNSELPEKEHATIDYVQVQDEELEALRAIFMEDFEEVAVKGAWNKTNDKAFRLQLRSYSDPEIAIILCVKLTATYPRSLPILSLEGGTSLRSDIRKKLDDVLATSPRELQGEVMIHEIATTIQDLLEDAVQSRDAKGALPSLEEERAVQEEKASRLAKEQAQEVQRKEEESKAEEDRVLAQMANLEMKRRKDARPRTYSAEDIPFRDEGSFQESFDTLTFDRPVAINAGGNFRSVRLLQTLENGPVTQLVLAQPIGIGSTLLAVKQVQIPESPQLKEAIPSLEDELEAIKKIRQAGLQSLLEFKLELCGDYWCINVLSDYVQQGSLRNLLEFSDTLAATKIRSITVELLEAVDFLHRNGIVHKRIHTGNVLLSGSSVVLADGGYQQTFHDLNALLHSRPKTETARSAFWTPPELAESDRRTRKTDIWDLGIVFLQLLFGLRTPERYTSATSLLDILKLSGPLEDLIQKFFKSEARKRPAAFDLIPHEFLRDDITIYAETRGTSVSFRRESTGHGLGGPLSRYAAEWVEVGRLGKGGYGEVVKARNKLDNRIYAIKKVKQRSSAALSAVLSEVMLLSQLNHPYVVRYYGAWPEEEADFSDIDESAIDDFEFESSNFNTDGLQDTTGGLDFVSSGYPKIEFGEGSDSDSEESTSGMESTEEPESSSALSPRKSPGSPVKNRTTNRAVNSTLYIQMELCERQTLRDLIRKEMSIDDSWRLFRQVLEGLAHIHGQRIIHRDLKPDNIFIDSTNSPRIGDFGLATTGQYAMLDRGNADGATDAGDMTRSVGTAFYVAPEVKTGSGGSYTEKVDMYSLGIIFFEMCHPLSTGMERDQVLRQIRQKDHTLPPDFQEPGKITQGEIINSLISHRPSERPSSVELLRSGKLPLQVEDDTMRLALQQLSDQNSSTFQKMMSVLFAPSDAKAVKDYVWDMDDAGASQSRMSDQLLQTFVKDRVSSVFRRHCAVESPRQTLFPFSIHYANSNAVRLLDSSGALLQQPYDLILPHARKVAKQKPAVDKTYTFGSVFRDTLTGGAPRSTGEIDFDIVSFDALDLALKEAEVLKVLDEIIEEFPSLASSQMCFHLNHSDLLDLILDFCRIGKPQRPGVKEALSKLNIQTWTWQKIRDELRSGPIAVASTSLDDLAKFDFRDTPDKAFAKLRTIFERSHHIDRTRPIFNHLTSIIRYLKEFDVKRKVYVCPLASFNEKFYRGGVLFQCLFDSKKREVLAAGGRYDSLIDEFQLKAKSKATQHCHAVGTHLSWERLVTAINRHLNKPSKSKKRFGEVESRSDQFVPRRADVLICSFDAAVLRSRGPKILALLWADGLSAELAVDARSMEDLLAHYKEDSPSWVVLIKHDTDLKVRNIARQEEEDVRPSELLNHMHSEIRERDQKEGISGRSRQQLQRLSSHAEAAERNNVHVLLAQHRGKKSNKYDIVERTQSRARELLFSYRSSPIAAIETRDEVLDLIRETRLSDPDSWRKAIQSVPLAERQYLQQVHDLLRDFRANAVDRTDDEGEAGKGAFVCNFRSGACIIYDLGS